MISILCVVGTRPEAIKMAPVIREIMRRGDRARAIVCSTGQHREMLAPVFELFGIVPDHRLDVMRAGQSLGQLSGRLFEALDRVVAETRPDWVLAQGDTTSVFVAAMVAFYQRVRFGHVEAGLRTNDRRNPFPEEINRRVADLVADAYFAPTARARQTLIDEGVAADRIVLTGNTVIDALQDVAALPFDWQAGPLATLPRNRRLVLITAHRRESFGAPLRRICLAIRSLAEAFGNDTSFVYPVHLNPDVRNTAHELLSGVPNVHLLEPLDYLAQVHLMKACTLILTDSGGIQEEAPGLDVPVLVLREATERPEGVEAGVARLVGTDPGRIIAETSQLLTDGEGHAAMAAKPNPYGDGQAARRIVAHLVDG